MLRFMILNSRNVSPVKTNLLINVCYRYSLWLKGLNVMQKLVLIIGTTFAQKRAKKNPTTLKTKEKLLKTGVALNKSFKYILTGLSQTQNTC